MTAERGLDESRKGEAMVLMTLEDYEEDFQRQVQIQIVKGVGKKRMLAIIEAFPIAGVPVKDDTADAMIKRLQSAGFNPITLSCSVDSDWTVNIPRGAGVEYEFSASTVEQALRLACDTVGV